MASASSASLLNQKQDLKSLLECSICLATFDDPRTLPCLHSFCKRCLENFVKGKHEDELNCPVCRYGFTLNEGVEGMTKNHFICNMLDALSIQHQEKCVPCSHCEQPSVGRCVTCELFMCEECLQSHNGYIGFRDHVVLTMEELSKPEHRSKIKGKSYCKKHTSKKLKLYCETCEELICTYCMSFEHVRPDHECSPLEEVAEKTRISLQTNCETLEKAIANSNSEMQILNEDRETLNNNFDTAQRLIIEREEQFLIKLQEILQIKTNSLKEITRQVFENKTKQVEAKINETETFVNRIKASANMARSLLENGNDEEIVRSFQSVQENVNNTIDMDNEKLNNENNVVLLWSSDEIDTMFQVEIKNIMKDKDDLGQEGAIEQSETENLGNTETHPQQREIWTSQDADENAENKSANVEVIPSSYPHDRNNRKTKVVEDGTNNTLVLHSNSTSKTSRSSRRRRARNRRAQTAQEKKDPPTLQQYANEITSAKHVQGEQPQSPSHSLPSFTSPKMNTPQHSPKIQPWGRGFQANIPLTTSHHTSSSQVCGASTHCSTIQGYVPFVEKNTPPTFSPTSFNKVLGAFQHDATVHGEKLDN